MSAQTNVPPIIIRPSEWEVVQGILSRYVPDVEVWAFGSRVTGEAGTYSDLDLVVLAPENLPVSTMAGLRWAFSVSDLPWKVDVLDWREMDEDFKQVIRRSRVVLKAA